MSIDRTTKVNRVKLLQTLQKNRAKHKEDYEESLSAFKQVAKNQVEESCAKAIKEIEEQKLLFNERIDLLKKDEIPKESPYVNIANRLTVELSIPHSYLDEYDTAIEMLNWDVEENVLLTSKEFKCFIQDDWDWKDEFLRCSAMYKSKVD